MWVQIIPIDENGQLHEAFNIRLEELQVIDIKFLHGAKLPTVAVLYQDTKEARHFKTYQVLLKDKARPHLLPLMAPPQLISDASAQQAVHRTPYSTRKAIDSRAADI